MNWINKIGRAALLAVVILLFVGVANAQTNSNVLTVPLQYNLSESLTLSVTSGSPQVFPTPGGNANAPLVIGIAWNFATAHHVSVVPYFTTANALTGTNLGGNIGVNYVELTSTGDVNDPGFSCNLTTALLVSNNPGLVTPSGLVSGNICPAIFNASEVAGLSSASTSVTIDLDLAGVNNGGPALHPLPDSYTGSLLIVGAYL